MVAVNDIQLNFTPDTLKIINIVLGIVMFGVALDLKVDDFKRIVTTGKAAVIGMTCQFVLMPALTVVLIKILRPEPSIALGMILIASCPGGNISNYLTHLARGNTALSVSMSAISTAAAIFMTPLNIFLWGSIDAGTRGMLREVELDPIQIFETFLVILLIPLSAGMLLRAKKAALVERIKKPIKILSLIFFGLLILGAVASNFHIFLGHLDRIAGIVFLLNGLALALGYFAAQLAGLGERDRRAVSIETGIQNSGLGLVLVFTFFDGLGGMALIAAWWSVWHCISGLALASFWNRREPVDVA